MGKAREAWREHRSTIVYGIAAAVVLAVLLPIHFSLAYHGQSDSNNQQLAALERQEDIRQQGFVFAVCGTSKDSRYVWEGILGTMGSDETAFCIHLGDAVHAPDVASYAYCLRQMEILDKPLLMVPGESETGGGSGAGTELYRDVFGEPYYSFSAGGGYFITLDDSGGEGIGSEQEAWLRGELEKSQAYQARMVFLHYPLFDPEGSPPGSALKDAEAARRLQGLFDEYGVDMVFASHALGAYEGNWGKTPYLVTGGAGAPIDDPDAEHRYYNYIKVSLYQDHVGCEVIETPGPPSGWRDRWSYLVSLHSYGFFAVWFWWDMLLLAVVIVLITTLLLVVRRVRSSRGTGPREDAPEADLAER